MANDLIAFIKKASLEMTKNCLTIFEVMRLLYMCLLIACISSFKLKKKYKAFQIDGYAQGITYHISYYQTDSLIAKQQIDSLLFQLDSSLSIYKNYSLISQFNISASGILMDRHLKKVIAKSVAVCRDTKGLFDITVQPLVQAWSYGIKKEIYIPDSSKIASILTCMGSTRLVIKKNSLIKTKPCVTIDVNGIA